jgi:hypothetical protein
MDFWLFGITTITSISINHSTFEGRRENPVAGKISKYIPLGENTSVLMTVKDSDEILSMSVPTHVANRNKLKIGVEIRVSLLSEGIHIMNRA